MLSMSDLGIALDGQSLSLSLKCFLQHPPIQLQAFAVLKDLPDHMRSSSGCNIVIYCVNFTSFTVRI